MYVILWGTIRSREILRYSQKFALSVFVIERLDCIPHCIVLHPRFLISFCFSRVHRALCSLFHPDTDGTRVSKCRQLPQQTRRPNGVSMLAQCRWRWANIETVLGQILAFAGLHTGVSTPTPPPP